MLARAALQSGIDLQSKAPGRSRLSPPRRDHEEALAHQHWRPCGLGPRNPIHLVRGLRIAETSGLLAILEERLEPAGVLDDSRGGRFMQFGFTLERHADPIHQPCTRSSLPAQNFSLRTILRIFPVPVLGNGSVENSTIRGSLNFPSCSSRNASSISSVSDSPGLSTTIAAGTSPHLSCGAATTAHSN